MFMLDKDTSEINYMTVIHVYSLYIASYNTLHSQRHCCYSSCGGVYIMYVLEHKKKTVIEII